MNSKLNITARAVTFTLAAMAGIAAAQTQTDIHRDSATRNVEAGDTFTMKYARAFYCNLPDNNNQIVINARGWNNQTGTGANASFRIPLTQIFDDVWFIGNHYVGQYMIRTADGIVQLDAGNTAAESALFHKPALDAFGAAGFPLKAVLLTHGHGDHDGGAKYLLDTFGARSWLGSGDAAGKSYAPNTIDSTDLSMREMSIGGKKFWVLPTPGHTPGATSAVLEVKDWGVTRRVLMNGGQSMNNNVGQVAQYLDSIERTYVMVKALHVDGVMTPHVFWDGEGEKLNEIRATGRTNPSQHVYGHEKVARQMVIARECSAAWLTRLDSTLVLPSWRYNTIEFVGGNPTPTRVAAQVKNGWGALVNAQVTFSVGETGASCTATTDGDGVASCAIRPLRPHRDHVKATFAGSESAEFVDLPAEASALACSNGNCNSK